MWASPAGAVMNSGYCLGMKEADFARKTRLQSLSRLTSDVLEIFKEPDRYAQPFL